MKAAISPKDEGRVITALPSSQFCLHLLIGLLKHHPPTFDFDTHGSIQAGDSKIMISTAGSGSGSNVEIVTDFVSIRAIG
jgi:hypothetical protein